MSVISKGESPPAKNDTKITLETTFESQDEHCDYLQPTEVDPCLPLTPPVIEIKLTHEGLASETLPNSTTPKSKISVTKTNGRLPWSGGELEGLVRKRFGLNHEGYLVSLGLVALVFVLVTIIIVLSALWPSTPHSHLFPVCPKAACLRASSVILPKLDSSVEPCQDFFTFACGGFMKSHPHPPLTRSTWGAEEERSLRTAEITRDVIATLPHPTKISSVVWKAKYFYDSCMALDNIETDKERPLKKIILELGGFQVLREFLVLAWDFRLTFVKLQLEYGVSPFFKVNVVPDPNNSKKSILELNPTALSLPNAILRQNVDDKVPSSYITYLKDVVQHLGANSMDADRFGKDMFYFERRLAEIMPPVDELNDISTHQVHNISYLKTLAPAVPIHEIVSALFPSANIGENTQVIVRSTQYFQALSMMLSSVDRSSLNNFLIWQLVKSYLSYINQDFLNIQFAYMRDTTGVKNPEERWEFCANALLRFQSLGIAAILESSVPEDVRSQKRGVVLRMFDTLRGAVKENVLKAEWIDLELYKHIIQKLDSMRIHVGLPNRFLEDLYLEKFYSKLFVQKNDFFQNINYGVKFLQEYDERRYVKPLPEYTWLHKMAEPHVSYDPATNSLLVPNGLLREPLFHADYPLGLLYGGLGVQMARQIIAGILPPHGLHTANGTLIPLNGLVANLSKNSLDPQLNCLGGANKSQSMDLFMSISAVRQSLRALKKAVKELPHVHQPGLENLEDSSLFLLMFGQEKCLVQSPLQSALDKLAELPLRGAHLLNVVKDNIKGFVEAYGCSAPAAPCKHIL